MTYIITARTASTVRTYCAIGNLDDLINAAIDAGALGITAMVRP